MSDWYWNIEDSDLIICPYCETASKPGEGEVRIGNTRVDRYIEKQQTVTCDICGKRFTILPHRADWRYVTETIDGEMTEEEWEDRHS